MRKKIVIVIPYEFYPPMSGGAIRCYYIVKELSRAYDVTVLTKESTSLVCSIRNNEFVDVNFSFSEKVKFDFKWLGMLLPERILNALFFKIKLRSLLVPVNSIFIDFFPVLRQLTLDLSPDVVLFENLESLYFLNSAVRSKKQKIHTVYDAHNVDHLLWDMLADEFKNKQYRQYAKFAKKIEYNLYRYTNQVIVMSEHDKIRLMDANNHLEPADFSVIPCGVDTKKNKFFGSQTNLKSNQILFCGSLNYLPNIQGLKWFYDCVFPLLKLAHGNFKLLIIGNCENLNDFEYLKNDPFVEILGRVEDVSIYYRNSALSVVPLLSGSGIRLKILESMSFGCPCVSTSIGAEGISYSEDSIIIADTPEQFANAIVLLLSDESIYNNIRMNARKLVESNYDWRYLIAKFVFDFEQL